MVVSWAVCDACGKTFMFLMFSHVSFIFLSFLIPHSLFLLILFISSLSPLLWSLLGVFSVIAFSAFLIPRCCARCCVSLVFCSVFLSVVLLSFAG